MRVLKFSLLVWLTISTLVAEELPVFQKYTGNLQGSEVLINGPQQIFVDVNDNIYLTDLSNFRAILMDRNGNILQSFDTIDPNDQSFRPSGIAVDSLGNVYVSDSLANHKIYKFSSTGTLIKSWGGYGSGLGQFDTPVDLAFTASGDLLVADSNNHRIQRLNLTTNSWTSWGSLGSGNGEFNAPSDVLADPQGNIWVLDSKNHRIQGFDSTGQFLTTFGSQGTGANQLGTFAKAMTLDANGKLLISDFFNRRVLRWDLSGIAELAFPTAVSGESGQSLPAGIATLSDGTIIVADPVIHVLKEFDVTGTFLGMIGSWLNSPGQVSSPIGLDVGPDGKLYVVDSGNSRVQIFNADGTHHLSFDGYDLRAIQVASNGDIYGCSPHQIQIFDADGVWQSSFGSLGTGNNQFNYPADLAFDASGNRYVADMNNNRILVFDDNWNFLRTIGADQLQRPARVRLDSDGNVFVSEYSTYRILKFLESGALVSQVSVPADQSEQLRFFPLSMDLDANDNLYVADRFNGRVYKFDNQFQLLYSFGKTGKGQSEFNSPLDIKLDQTGNLHVLDTGNHRIQSFNMTTPDLSFTMNTPVEQGVVVTAFPKFDWNPASSLIGVRYELTVASDAALSQVVFVQSDLDTTSHVATTALLDGTYYWSVTVTDAVDNSWTTPVASFLVNTTIAPVIESLSMFKASLRLNANADIRSQVGNQGASPVSGMELFVRVTPPGLAASDLPANAISTLNPGASVNFSDLFSDTQLEGLYAVEAILRDSTTHQIYDVATTTFSVGAPNITKSTLLGTDYNGGYLSTTAPSFSSTIRNGSSLAMPVQHQIEILDTLENPVLDGVGNPVCLASVAVPALASGGNDATSLTAPLLASGNYIARFSAVNGDACNGPSLIYDIIDVPFSVSDLVLSNLSVANAFQDNAAAITMRLTNWSNATISGLTLVVEVRTADGALGNAQPNPLLVPDLAGGSFSNLNLNYVLPINASLGSYDISAKLFIGTVQAQEMTGSFTVLEPISITQMSASRITGQGGPGIKLQQLRLLNNGLNSRNTTVYAYAQQNGVTVSSASLPKTLPPGTLNMGGELNLTTPIGTYDVIVQIMEGTTVLATGEEKGVVVR